MHSKFLANTPLVINLRGVDYMNDDPFEVNILYMKVHTVDGSDRCENLFNIKTAILITVTIKVSIIVCSVASGVTYLYISLFYVSAFWG